MKSDFDKQIATAQAHLKKLKGKNAELEKLIADAAVEQKRLDSLLKVKSRPIHKTVVVRNADSGGGQGATSSSVLQKSEDDIFHMSAAICAVYNGQTIPLETTGGGILGWTGTGYLLSDGRFVTAKHCVEGWKFDSDKSIASQMESLKEDTNKMLFLAGLCYLEGV